MTKRIVHRVFLIEDEDFDVSEIRTCNCFLDWTYYFLEKNSEELSGDKFVADFIPENNDCCGEIYILFGDIIIVCCERALYHLFYKNDIENNKMNSDCLPDQVDMCCMYFLNGTVPFEYICSNCQLNFLDTISRKRFTKIKT